MNSKQWIAIFALLLATFISALGFFFIKKGISSLSPSNLIFWRHLIAASLLFVFSFRSIQRNIIKPGAFLGILLLGNLLFQYMGLQTIPVSTTSFVMGFAVVLVPLFISWIHKTPLKPKIWIAAFLAFVGIGVISLHSGFSLALGWVLLGAVCFAIYIIFVGNYSNTHHLIVLNMIQCATICLFSGIIAWSTHTLALPMGNGDYTLWIYISILAVFNSVIAIWLQFYAQKHLNPTTAAIIVSSEPIFATLIAVVLLSEHLTVSFYLGAILIFLAILLSELNVKKPRAPQC